MRQIVRLGEIITYNKGYAFSSSEYCDEGIMVVRVSDFTLDSISSDNAVFIDERKEFERYCINEGDILIQTVGSWANNPNSIVGKVVRVPNECQDMYLNQNIVRIIPKKGVDNSYLYYALKANKFSDYCVMRGQGAANQASITLNTIFRFKFELPDYHTQKAIVDILSDYDKIINCNNKRIQILEQMAENLYKEWFVRFRFPGYENTKFEHGIPNVWKAEHVNEIGQVVAGGTPSTEIEEYWSGDIPWLTPADLSGFSGIYISAGSTYITEVGLKKSSATMMPPNTVLLSSRAPIGYVALARNAICTNQGFKSVICKEDVVNHHYLYWYFKMNKATLEAFGSGTTFLELSSKGLKKVKVIVPPIVLQNQFSEIAGNIAEQVYQIERVNENLKKQRDLLLPRLMSGKLEVK